MISETTSSNKHRGDPRRGIALVIVMGLMAMLIIMGVAFATSMRTEHKAARMASDQLGSMEIVYYALAEAMNHLEIDASTPPSGPWYAPNWPAFTIHSGNNGTHANKLSGKLTDMLSWYGAWFVPHSILDTARSETNNVRWIQVRSPDNQVVGQFTYMIMDCTGMLDANGNHETNMFLAMSHSRGAGTNACELALSNALLKEMRAKAETNLYAGRVGVNRFKGYGRAETLPDLRVVTWDGYPNADSRGGSTSPFRIYNFATNFYVYNRYLPGYADASGNAKDQVFIGGTGPELNARKSEIQAAIQGVGLPSTEAATLTKDIIDYVDTDVVPGGLESEVGASPDNCDNFCTEPVPMFNELQVANVYSTSGGTISHRIRLQYELIFPFMGVTNDKPCVLRAKMELVGGNFEPKDIPIQAKVIIPAGSITVLATNATTPRFWQGNILFPASTASATNAQPPEKVVITELTLLQNNTADEAIANPGPRLDRVSQNGGPFEIKVTDYLSEVPTSSQAIQTSWAANDPRINWDFTKHWRIEETKSSSLTGGSMTWGSMNTGVTGEKDEWYMYVRNGPMISVGELQYLLYHSSRSWRTISFVGSSDMPTILDRFTVFTNDVRYGLVNISSRVPAVLATAFNQCPIEIVPGVVPPGMAAKDACLTPAESLEIAEAIMAKRPSAGYMNLSELRLVDMASVAPRVTSWSAREGLIRNTLGLLGIRGNVFSVLLVGQAQRQFVDPENGKTVTERLSGHRAMATVWRDPYLANGRHNMFVRTLRWYDEWVGGVDDFDDEGP